MHFTSIALIGVLIGYDFYKRRNFILKLLPILGIILISLNLEYLSFLDPRIDLYRNWASDGYGNPVAGFQQLAFVIMLLFIALHDNKFNVNIFIYSFLFSAILSLSFFNIAIFSFRLTNICMSFYPYFLAKLITGKLSTITKLSYMSVIILLLSFRQGNLEILESIVLGFE